ncbi:MAG: hypothetical protein H7338_19810 [Candidatus Sericytochromatia bacterium]|nr:hypothetical protein [Candidatus Sericytochromatia bacterium]
MARLSRTEHQRLIRALKAAGEEHLAARIAEFAGPEPADGLVIRSLRLQVQSSSLVHGRHEIELPATVTALLLALAATGECPVSRAALADRLDSWPARVRVMATEARHALRKISRSGPAILGHDPQSDSYWLSPDWPMLVVA